MRYRGGQAAVPHIEFDPCYLAQEATRPCTSADIKALGTWLFPLRQGNWVWKIAANGTYRFHREANDGASSHAGVFTATKGQWTLTATTGLPTT